VASELATSVSVETAHLTLLGKHLALAERELAAARAMLADLGAPAVRITQLPGCGDGTAPVAVTTDTAGASQAAKRDVSVLVRTATPTPPTPPRAGGPDWAAFVGAIGEGCTVAFAQANVASMGTHARSSGMPCGHCVSTMRMKWLAAQKRAGIAPATAPQAAAPAPAPVPAAAPVAATQPLSAALKARAREYVTQLGMTPQDAIATAKADLASEAAARGEPATATVAVAPVAAPAPAPSAPAAAPAATERPVPTLAALDAEMADVLTESKRQWMRDVVAARMQGLADPALPQTDWASEKNAVKLLRRIAKAARVA
jgi:pyruvate/2-oxoglutarate dehydrogenase complex dihydrolipoamide acyltransferase (E2) component